MRKKRSLRLCLEDHHRLGIAGACSALRSAQALFEHIDTHNAARVEKTLLNACTVKKKLVFLQHEFKIGKNMANDKNTSKPQEKKPKKVNKTWEAMGKYQGAFTIIDPKFLL